MCAVRALLNTSLRSAIFFWWVLSASSADTEVPDEAVAAVDVVVASVSTYDVMTNCYTSKEYVVGRPQQSN
jgi:hypothetical protein